MYNQGTRPNLQSSNQQILIIKNLHPNVTEEILYKELKHQGFEEIKIILRKNTNQNAQAFVTFNSKDKRNEAFKKLQFKQILQRRIVCFLYSSSREDKNKNKFFLNNIKSTANPEEIFNLLTSLGDLSGIQIYFDKHDKPVGKGFFQLQNDEEFRKKQEELSQGKQLIEFSEDNKDNYFEIEHFEKKQDEKQDCRLTIQDIQSVNESDIQKFQQISQQKAEEIKQSFEKQGIQLESVIYRIQKSTKDQAIITFKDSKEASEFIRKYDEKDTNINKLLKSISQTEEVPSLNYKYDKYKDYKGLYSKYLQPSQNQQGDQNPEDYIKEVLTCSFQEQLGKKDIITGMDVRKGQKPAESNNINKLPDSYYALIYLKRGEYGLDFLTNYNKIKDEDFKNLFINHNINFTILLNKAERRQLKKGKVQHQRLKQQENAAQLQGYGAQQMMNGPINTMMYQQRMQQQQYPQQHRQQQVPQNMQQQQQVPQQQAPQQQTQSGQFNSIEDITQKTEQFIKLTKNQQFQSLGSIFLPTVQKYLQEKYPNHVEDAEKITSMIVDLENFELGEILENWENQQEFVERIQESIELLEGNEEEEQQ